MKKFTSFTSSLAMIAVTLLLTSCSGCGWDNCWDNSWWDNCCNTRNECCEEQGCCNRPEVPYCHHQHCHCPCPEWCGERQAYDYCDPSDYRLRYQSFINRLTYVKNEN